MTTCSGCPRQLTSMDVWLTCMSGPCHCTQHNVIQRCTTWCAVSRPPLVPILELYFAYEHMRRRRLHREHCHLLLEGRVIPVHPAALRHQHTLHFPTVIHKMYNRTVQALDPRCSDLSEPHFFGCSCHLQMAIGYLTKAYWNVRQNAEEQELWT